MDKNHSVKIRSDYRETLAVIMTWQIARNTDRRFFRRLNKRRLIILTNRGDVTTPLMACTFHRPTKTFNPKYPPLRNFDRSNEKKRKGEGEKGARIAKEEIIGENWPGKCASRTTFQDFQREKETMVKYKEKWTTFIS